MKLKELNVFLKKKIQENKSLSLLSLLSLNKLSIKIYSISFLAIIGSLLLVISFNNCSGFKSSVSSQSELSLLSDPFNPQVNCNDDGTRATITWNPYPLHDHFIYYQINETGETWNERTHEVSQHIAHTRPGQEAHFYIYVKDGYQQQVLHRSREISFNCPNKTSFSLAGDLEQSSFNGSQIVLTPVDLSMKESLLLCLTNPFVGSGGANCNPTTELKVGREGWADNFATGQKGSWVFSRMNLITPSCESLKVPAGTTFNSILVAKYANSSISKSVAISGTCGGQGYQEQCSYNSSKPIPIVVGLTNSPTESVSTCFEYFNTYSGPNATGSCQWKGNTPANGGGWSPRFSGTDPTTGKPLYDVTYGGSISGSQSVFGCRPVIMYFTYTDECGAEQTTYVNVPGC